MQVCVLVKLLFHGPSGTAGWAFCESAHNTNGFACRQRHFSGLNPAEPYLICRGNLFAYYLMSGPSLVSAAAVGLCGVYDYRRSATRRKCGLC